MNKIQIPSHWKLIKLGEYCEKPEYGYTASATEKNTGYKFLRITDIQDGTVKWENVPYCEVDGINIDKYILFSGDIVVARIGATTGKSFLITDCQKSLFASYLIRIRTKNGLLAEFLNFYFDAALYWQQINANKGGKLKGGVNIPIIQSLLVPLPPISEQIALAHILRTIQKAKKARQRELELERERKAALMEYLFTHGTRNEERKETEIGEIPKSWEMVNLQQVADIVYGVQAAIAHLTDKEVGIPILTNINITNQGALDLTTLRYYELPESKKDKLILKSGDILFNWRSGSQDHVGKTALFNLYQEYTFSSFILRFRANKKVNNIYLFYYLQYLKSQGFFARKSSQSSINSVFNASVAAKIPVMLPLDLDEQLKIINILGLCDRKIQALEKEISLIDELFHATLEQLMTGQISTQPLTEVQV